jgi:hypothetical protein
MRRALIAVVLFISFAAASTALAAYQYAPPRQWSPGQGAGSYYSNGWLANYFMTYGSGTDKSVTFINSNGGWHNTRRGTGSYLETYPPYPGTFKAHCVSHSWFWGSCNVR